MFLCRSQYSHFSQSHSRHIPYVPRGSSRIEVRVHLRRVHKNLAGPIINYGSGTLFFKDKANFCESLIQQAVLNPPLVIRVKRLALLLRSADLYTLRVWPQLVNLLKGLPKGDEKADIYSVLDGLYPSLEELM
jgi:hypothetical protein